MAYGPEVKNGLPSYEAVFLHTGTGVKLQAFVFTDGGATEGQINTVFQALVDRLLGMANVSLESADRTTTYKSAVTQTL